MKLTQNETNNPHNKDDQNVKEKKNPKKLPYQIHDTLLQFPFYKGKE